MRLKVLSGISPPFDGLFQAGRQVVYVLLTRAPLYSPAEASFLVRLACVKHAASVRSEPGSNSQVLSPCESHQGSPSAQPHGQQSTPEIQVPSTDSQFY